MAAVALVGRLFDGPIDIVADIHGECGALTSLLDHLGYDGNGEHSEGRRLVFLGDLVDRGPDSPGVVRLVRHLVEKGKAQCILGNHELNLLRNEHKHGNHWFYGEPEVIRKDKAAQSFQVLADEAFRSEVREFFLTLPMALEREDLIVVHAAWDEASAEKLRSFDGNAIGAYDFFDKQIQAAIVAENITDQDEIDMREQNLNPIKVMSSGYEGRAAEPFFAGGKMRTLERLRWWESYEAKDDRLVVIGHYWRRFLDEVSPQVSEKYPKGFAPSGADMFPGYSPSSLLGKKKKVMCVDFSVGVRYEERGMGLPEGSLGTALAALRLPEMTLHRNDAKVLSCG
ncbi:prpE [Symbiodinium sp. CCMP2592]|nr:prpE [Symbiodinium sp. CCMP2592]